MFSLEGIDRLLASPPASARPTPLFWWSGGDVDRDRLAVQLGELASKGIGGTIVGYSHLPEGDLDHGDPTPLSSRWWEMFRWFTDASARLGMTVGLQDYGINGPLLVEAGRHTREFRPGSLEHRVEHHHGSERRFVSASGQGTVLAAVARPAANPASTSDLARNRSQDVPLAISGDGSTVTGILPNGSWDVSLVVRIDPMIGRLASSFDPLHPEAGQLLITSFYQQFVDELGDRVGTTFTTLFQDELDFGVRMPMWNDLVAERLQSRYGFDPTQWLPALWLDLGEGTLGFRAAYRDVVVELLEQHYFEPIFRWHRAHGTSMYVDQISRGDLRAGRRHYGDYMQTMRWYDGPGNDDPDLTTPRSVAAFKVSASLARLNDRPVVANEAFHSSGWGIEPEIILAGLNAGFAYGVNHVIMHGLNHTTAGGWWEWASPDFHFRQPWWQHSDTLWTYVSRVSALLRWGHGVAEVAILDPTQDLDLTGDQATSPELATTVLAELGQAGHDADLLDRAQLASAAVVGTGPQARLVLDHGAHRAVVVPDLRAVRSDTRDALVAFAAAGGLVAVLGRPPDTTEVGPCGPETWSRTTVLPIADTAGASTDRLVALFAEHWEPDFDARGTGLVAVHRRDDQVDLYFITNVTDDRVTAAVDLRSIGEVHLIDPWTVDRYPASYAPAVDKAASTRVTLDLPAGLAIVVVVDRARPPVSTPDLPPVEPVASGADTRLITGPWQTEIVACLDNQFGDFEYGSLPLGVETWVVDHASSPDGRWSTAQVRDGAAFLVLGPVPRAQAAEIESLILASEPIPGTPCGPDRAWRPYGLSYRTGITGDPLLLDRLTGPHGLKGVPDEFLDPTVLDPDAPPGSLYYFWSTVDSAEGPVTVAAGSRAAYGLWIDGRLLLEQPDEVPAAYTPAWHLRDLSVVSRSTEQRLASGRHDILMRVQVASGQPTRASLAVGPQLPTCAPRPRLRWWFGDQPGLLFDAFPNELPPTVFVRLVSPPGTTAADLVVHGRVASAVLGSSGQCLGVRDAGPGPEGSTRVRLSAPEPLDATDEIIVEIRGTTKGYQGAALLAEPVRWVLGTGVSGTSWFLEMGLREYSGLVRFRTAFDWVGDGSDTAVRLSLPGLLASARIRLNGTVAGTLVSGKHELDVGRWMLQGPNTIEVEVANTMVNRFSVLPSPFVRQQQPGGGFAGVRLVSGP